LRGRWLLVVVPHVVKRRLTTEEHPHQFRPCQTPSAAEPVPPTLKSRST